MIWISSLVLGIALGLVFFGGLWLTVRAILGHPQAAGLMPLSQIARLLILGVGFAFVSQHGPGASLAVMCGLWLSRCWLVWRLGEVSRAD